MLKNMTHSRIAPVIFSAIFALTAAGAAQAAGEQTNPGASTAREMMASGVSMRIKEGAKATAAEIAARNKVSFDKLSPGMFGAIKLERSKLVPLPIAAADAERLRADPDVSSASADYVIQSSYTVR